MQDCLQTKGQSVYQHGVSVRDYLFQIINWLETGKIQGEWRLPEWLTQYRDDILNSLLSKSELEQYTLFHDCGKPYCRTVDEEGRSHFPNHAEVSYETWIRAGGDEAVGKLIRMDMLIHTMKVVDVDSFIQNGEAISLLLTGLSEIHSNAQMFGGIDSVSFKIK